MEAIPAPAAAPAASAAAAPPASTAELVALADGTIADVRSVRAAGEQLVEALADSASCMPSQLQEQVAVLLQGTVPVLDRAQSAWARLRQLSQASSEQTSAKAQAAQEAAQVSKALGELQQQAAQLATGGGKVSADGRLDRPSQAQALKELAARVSCICGHEAHLLSAAPAAAGRPGRLAPCAAADATQVHLTLGSTLVACVALAQPGSLDAVRLAVFSADEGGGRRASAWGQSQHAVFQRVSAWGMQALGHFQRRARPAAFKGLASADATVLDAAFAGAALEDLLLWLTSYEDLFSRRCAATGTLLAADAASQNFYPPFVRPFALSRAQLLEDARRAGGGGAREAYHPHAAPAAVLQPAQMF